MNLPARRVNSAAGWPVWLSVAEKHGFEEYVHTHGTALVRLARLLTGDPHRAEDLVQDVLTRAYPRWHRIMRADRPELYLRRMMVNLNTSWWRRRVNREVRVADPFLPADVRDVGGEAAQRLALWAEVAALPARQRAVVALRYYEDLDDQRISEILGCSPATVRTHAMRGLAAMRDRLQPGETEAPMHPGEEIDTARLAGAATRAGRRRETARRSAIAAAIAAFTAAATTVPVLLWSGGLSLTPGQDGVPDSGISPPVRGAYAVHTPPPAGGAVAADQPTLVGSDPFTFHFDFAPFPYPTGEVRWSVRDGEESAYVELVNAEGYGRALTLRLARGTGPAAFATPDASAQVAQPSPMTTSSVLVGDRPGTLAEPPQPTGHEPLDERIELTWQPVAGVVAVLASDALSAQDLVAVAAGLRLANRRCSVPLRFSALPQGAGVLGCSYGHFGGTQNTSSGELVLGRPGAQLTVSVRADLRGSVLPSASAAATAHGFTYAVEPSDYYSSVLHAVGAFDVSVTTRGDYGRPEAVQVMEGLIPAGDPADTGSWPLDPIG